MKTIQFNPVVFRLFFILC